MLGDGRRGFDSTRRARWCVAVFLSQPLVRTVPQ